MKNSKLVLAAGLAALLAGCDGKPGANGPTGPPGPGVPSYTVNFQDNVSPSGYAGSQVTSPEEGSATTSYNNQGLVSVGYNTTYAGRALFKFSIGGFIPYNATVVAAALQLDLITVIASAIDAGTQSVGVYDMDLPAMASCAWTTAATWNDYDGSNPWGNCAGGGPFTFGVNFNPTPMDTVGLGKSSPTGPYAWNLSPAMVQKWINVANQGIVLACPTEATTPASTYDYFLFGPPSSGTAYARPTLMVRYTVP